MSKKTIVYALGLIVCGATSCSWGDVFRISDDDPELLEAPEDEIPASLSTAEQNCMRLGGNCGGLKCVSDHDCSGAGQRCIKSLCTGAPPKQRTLLEGAEAFEENVEVQP